MQNTVMKLFSKIVNGIKPLTVFARKLHLRCLTVFLTRLCISITSKTTSRAEYIFSRYTFLIMSLVK